VAENLVLSGRNANSVPPVNLAPQAFIFKGLTARWLLAASACHSGRRLFGSPDVAFCASSPAATGVAYAMSQMRFQADWARGWRTV
jgi:hypothetical protein